MIKKILMLGVFAVGEILSYGMDDACQAYSSGLPRSPTSVRSPGGGSLERPLIERIQVADAYSLTRLLDEASKIRGTATSKYPYARAFFEKFKQSQKIDLPDRYSLEIQFRISQYLFQYGRNPENNSVDLQDYGCSTLMFLIQKGGFHFSFSKEIIVSIQSYIQSLKEKIEHEHSILKSRGDRPDMTPLPSKRSYGSQLILSDLTSMPLLYLFEIARNKFTLNGDAPNSFHTRLRAAQILLDKALAL